MGITGLLRKRRAKVPVYRIRKYPDPVLRRESAKVEGVGPAERKILAQMAETMYSLDGIGLAAPQVGIAKQFIVADVGEGIIKLANPRIVFQEGESKMEEGCLSIPGVNLEIKRAKKVIVEGLNEKGKQVKISADGLLAHVLQHEIDHLRGILIIDRIDGREKEKFKPRLTQLEKEFESYYLLPQAR